MSEKILATISEDEFIGRSRELEMLWRHANGDDETRELWLLSAPAVGASELLRQTYDRLFQHSEEIIPFYFSIKNFDKTAKNCARRFAQTFITQIIAFGHQDAKLLNLAPDICELVELAAPNDAVWIKRFADVCQNQSQINDDRAFVRNCLSAPLRAAAYGANAFVMIDNLDEALNFSDDIDFVEELKEIYSRSTVPFVLAGKRRFTAGAMRLDSRQNDARILRVDPLEFSEAAALTKKLAAKYKVAVNEQTGDLIAGQFGGRTVFIKYLLQAASEKRAHLDSFQRVEQIYADEIFSGRIGRFYDAIFQKAAASFKTQANIVEVLNEMLTAETPSKRRSFGEVYQFMAASDDELTREDFQNAIRILNVNEVVRASSNIIEPSNENEVLNDYLRARFRLESAIENRGLVVGEMLSDLLKRAPQTMAQHYRQNSIINLREFLAEFDGREIPASLIDYTIYKNEQADTDKWEIISGETETIRLPQVVYTAHTAAFYPAISQVTETACSAVAFGFEHPEDTDECEIIWLAAEINSKLEAAPETAEFWCDRLEMVALTCNFLNYKIWLVAPEGFTPEAMEILAQRNAYGSSRRQVNALKTFLRSETSTDEKSSAADEYEMVIPMGADTELIAANAVEEIARRHHFESKAINQIKTALVEACINAAEHSLSPDRKIYQKFTVEADKIVILISNRGLRFNGVKPEEINNVEGRRGWGLKLMRTLMDEVKFERVDDGTRIIMTKYLKK